jgi:NAD(P)-dependent dehydrogenase (short-subunit alcohol dehydrogenase family)
MNANHQHKYALVTGGNQGIGFAICQGLLAIGGRSSETILSRNTRKYVSPSITQLGIPENRGKACELNLILEKMRSVTGLITQMR